jgi:membrane associated rhomboid family serine protease
MLRMLTPAVLGLIAANFVIFLLERIAFDPIVLHFALWPPGPYFQPWQLVTYAFVHAGWLDILFNMFGLFIFAPALERYWGARRFLIYYFVCVIAAGLTQIAVQHATGNPEPTIGASGGVFGVLLAFAWLFPRAQLLLLLPPIPMPAWLFVSIYGLLELFFGVTGIEPGIAHFAHLGGLLGGAIMMLLWRVRPDPERWRSR